MELEPLKPIAQENGHDAEPPQTTYSIYKIVGIVSACIFALVVVLLLVSSLSGKAVEMLEKEREESLETYTNVSFDLLRLQSELYDIEFGSFQNFCKHTDVQQILSSIPSTSGVDCKDSNEGWVVMIPKGESGYQCVDSTGNSTVRNSAVNDNDYVCESTNARVSAFDVPETIDLFGSQFIHAFKLPDGSHQFILEGETYDTWTQAVTFFVRALPPDTPGALDTILEMGRTTYAQVEGAELREAYKTTVDIGADEKKEVVIMETVFSDDEGAQVSLEKTYVGGDGYIKNLSHVINIREQNAAVRSMKVEEAIATHKKYLNDFLTFDLPAA